MKKDETPVSDVMWYTGALKRRMTMESKSGKVTIEHVTPLTYAATQNNSGAHAERRLEEQCRGPWERTTRQKP